jgi:hypothetical protein
MSRAFVRQWNPTMNRYQCVAAVVASASLMLASGCGGDAPVVKSAGSADGTLPEQRPLERTITVPNDVARAGDGFGRGVFPPLPRQGPSRSNNDTWDDSVPGSETNYARTIKRCEDLDGSERTVCVNMAEAARASR